MWVSSVVAEERVKRLLSAEVRLAGQLSEDLLPLFQELLAEVCKHRVAFKRAQHVLVKPAEAFLGLFWVLV